jgi:hypothetical protein
MIKIHIGFVHKKGADLENIYPKYSVANLRFYSHSWALIQYYYALLVSLVHDFLSIRIMGSPETISTKPLEHVKISSNQWKIQTLASYLITESNKCEPVLANTN